MGEGSHRWACRPVLKCHVQIISLLVSASQNGRDSHSLPIHWTMGCYSLFSLCHLRNNTELRVPLSNGGCPWKVLCWTYVIRSKAALLHVKIFIHVCITYLHLKLNSFPVSFKLSATPSRIHNYFVQVSVTHRDPTLLFSQHEIA